MLILLNKNANNGKGFQKWIKIKSDFVDKYINEKYNVISDLDVLSKRLQLEFKRGERFVVAAGGDGTIHTLLNHLMQLDEKQREQLILGAIGLGSSNDFHKPFADDKYLAGCVPFRLDSKNALHHNIGRVDYLDMKGEWNRKFFLLNCSIGIIAQANQLFNSCDRVVQWMKSKWVTGTIWYSALKTLLTSRNIPTKIKIVGKTYKTDVTNLSILISPHVSGDLCYDFNVSPQSPFFGVALCERMGLFSRLRTIAALANAKFSGLPKTRSWRTNRVEIFPKHPVPLELDGEIYMARRIKITLMKGDLRVCQ